MLKLENQRISALTKSAKDGHDDQQENFGDDEQANSDQDMADSNLNIMEKFR